MPTASIFEAVREGNLEAVKRLVGHDLTLLAARDPLRNDRTPLILACYYKKSRVVRFLLDQGADVNATNRHGKTAAHYVCMNGASIILQLLLEKGADVTLRDEEGYTPLMYAAFYAREQVLRALLKLPAPLVAATVDERLTADVLHTGKTALMLAAFKHFTQGVKLLLEEGGANPYVTDDRGRTALDLVCFLGRNDKVRVMEGMLLNAMREPQRALALHKARILSEVDSIYAHTATNITTTTATGGVSGSGLLLPPAVAPTPVAAAATSLGLPPRPPTPSNNNNSNNNSSSNNNNNNNNNNNTKPTTAPMPVPVPPATPPRAPAPTAKGNGNDEAGGGIGVAIGSTEQQQQQQSQQQPQPSQQQLLAVAPKCLRARVLKGQPLPRLDITDPLTQQAQGPGMGRAAFQQMRRTGEVREAVVQHVVHALPDDLYTELLGFLRLEWPGADAVDETRTPSALVRAASATALAAQVAQAEAQAAAAAAAAAAAVVVVEAAAVVGGVGVVPPVVNVVEEGVVA